MARISFGEWRPDVDDLNAGFSRQVSNVVPRSDGYGPFHDLEAFTAALPGACRGAFLASVSDSTVQLFAGTVNNLYLLDNSTLEWTEVSQGGADYTDLNDDANWVFAQVGNFVIVTQKNEPMQVYELGSSSAFADLAGSPPRAGWIGQVGPFLVAADLLNDPFDIHWSAINSVVGWTIGTDRSDQQPMPDGGRVRAVVELVGNVGLIFQETAVRRMTWSPGSSVVFDIDKFATVPGTTWPYSITVGPGGAYYLSQRGFVVLGADGALQPIGEERVNRTFFGEHALSAPEAVRALAYDQQFGRLVIGATDPKTNLVLWVYKSDSSTDEAFDQALIFHTTLNRWAPAQFHGEYIAAMARPGLTLEALDAIAPGAVDVTGAANNGSGLIRLTVTSTTGWTTGDVKTISGVVGTTEANATWTITVIDGTHVDLQGSTFTNAYTSGGVVGGSVDELTFSLDDIANSSLPDIAAVTTAHKVAFFAGSALEAVIEAPESGLDGYRMEINGVRPVTDAATVYASIAKRDALNGEPELGDESEMDSDGYCPLLEETRYARGRIRIPAGTEWTFCSGFAPDVRRAGEL